MRASEGGGGGAVLGIEIPDGDPGALTDGASALRRISGVLDHAGAQFDHGSPVGWTGSAAMNFMDMCGTEGLAATRGSAAMALGARILTNLAEDLRAVQKACRAEVEAARHAQTRAERARTAATLAGQRATAARQSETAAAHRASAAEGAGLPSSAERAFQQDAANRAAQEERAQGRAERDARSADEDLETAQRRGQNAARRYHETARQAAAMLGGLAEQAPVVTAVNGQPVAATGGPGQPPGVIPVTVTASPAPKKDEDDGDGGGLLNGIVHGALDVGGLVPVIGAPADGLNAIIYEAQGDHVNAGLSAAGMIPIAGEIATGGKLIGKGAKAVEAARDTEKVVDGVSDAGKVAKDVPPGTRPSWRQSEEDVLGDLGPHYKGQKSYIDGAEVPYSTKGSVRPDGYSSTHGESIEVKNYDVSSSSGRSKLVRNISDQVLQRVAHLPPDTNQRVVIDLRGQDVGPDVMQKLGQKIQDRTGGVVGPDQIQFLRE